MKIKEVRQKLGLTQKQIAPLLGTTQQGVGRIESGYEGRRETAGQIAALVALDLLNEHNLIDELIEKHRKI